MKICFSCKIKKENFEFNRRKDSKDGLKSNCKECRKKSYYKYKDKNRDKKNENARNHYKLHKKELYERKKLRQEELLQKLVTVEIPDTHKQCSICNLILEIENYFKHSTFCKECTREKARNKSKTERYRRVRKIYENSIEFKEKQRKKNNETYKTNTQVNLRKKIRSHLRKKLLRFQKKHPKKLKTIEFLDCNIHFLNLHFKSQFVKNMTEQDFLDAKIEIDHYIPFEAFDLTNLEETKVCTHWTNLRPLWKFDNISKNDKMPDGNSAKKSKHLYSLLDKKKMIYDRLISLKLPHITNKLLNQLFPEFRADLISM